MYEGYSREELIAAWLAVTTDRRFQADFSVEEALRRARAILPLILAGESNPAAFECDEAFKNVLYALVRIISETDYENAEARAAAAQAVYSFVSEVSWEPDEFGEKEDLLRDCRALAHGVPSRGKDSSSASESRTGASDEDENVRTPPWGPPGTGDPADEGVRAVFQEAAELIHPILTSVYHLTDVQASSLERNLYYWFVRFRQREGAGRPRDDRALLLLNCLRFAQAYQGDSGAATAPSEEKREKKP